MMDFGGGDEWQDLSRGDPVFDLDRENPVFDLDGVEDMESILLTVGSFHILPFCFGMPKSGDCSITSPCVIDHSSNSQSLWY